MDFVVFGFGLGAILMLVGFALRDLGPWLFGSTRDEEALPEFEGVRSTIRKQILSSIGNAISVGGAGVAAVTFAALLSKAEDQLGAIVVGMSLVLATVGVGAWSYDVFRRYRAAMDIVAVQEQAVRERLAPRPKRRRPKPAPVEQPPDQSTTHAPADDPQVVEESAIAASANTEPESAINDQDELLEDDQHTVDGAAGDAVPAQQNDGVSALSDVDDEHAPRESEELVDDRIDLEDEAFYANLEFHPETRVTPPEGEMRPVNGESKPVALPQHQEVPEDALIDESVRFEPRPERNPSVPSWLFEDLEADLASQGPNRPDESIDQFHDATPMKRPSALDRLLAGEQPARSEPGDSPDQQSRRRPLSTDDD